MRTQRREFLKVGAATVGGALLAKPLVAADAPSPPKKPVLCLFSKPLQHHASKDLPPMVTDLGFAAVDLTCRPGGHVLPERVADDLPKALELLKAAGIAIPMITTGILDAGKDHAEEIVKTAAGLGIRYAKIGYYNYGDLRRIHTTLADVKARLRDVAALFKQYGVQAGFHNHSGATIGAAMWDVWNLIRDLPPEAMGAFYDGGHATVEGGHAGWEIGLNLLASRLVMLSVKDFFWQKDPKTKWQAEWGPLGKGMVRWEEILRRVKELQFAGPITMHMEYVPHGSDEEVFAAIRHDADVLRGWLKRAELM